MRMVAIELGMWRSGRNGGSSGAVTCGNDRLREDRGGARSCGGNRLPLGDQESISGDAECCVMVKAAPSPTFKMPKTDFLLELLVVALNAPAQFGEVDKTTEGDVLGKRRQKVFGRFVLAFGPLDQQPFLRTHHMAPLVAPRGAHPHPGKARRQHLRRTFAPFDRVPGTLGQAERKVFNRDRPMLGVAPQARWWSSAARPLLRRQWPFAACPHRP